MKNEQDLSVSPPENLNQSQFDAIQKEMIPILPELVSTISAIHSALTEDDPDMALIFSSHMVSKLEDLIEEALEISQ